MRKKNMILGIVTLGFLGLLCGYWFLEQPESIRVQENLSTSTETLSSSVSSPVALKESEVVTSTQPETTPPSDLDWMVPKKEYLPYLKIKAKVILSNQDKEDFLKSLNSKKILSTAIQDLKQSQNQLKLNFKYERNRMNAVNYLSSVMNPDFESENMNEAIDFAIAWLEKKVTFATQTPEQRQSMIGDKIELAIALAQFHPNIWKEYKLNHPSKRQIKLIKLVEQQQKKYGKSIKNELSHI